MTDLTYRERRGQIETYFDRTAVQAWARLTSDAPVGRVRATVRAGRDDAACLKPAPDLFLAAAAALGVPASACLVIEDSSAGMAAARAAGMPVLGFTAYCGPYSLRSGAQAYISSFEGFDLIELHSLWRSLGET